MERAHKCGANITEGRRLTGWSAWFRQCVALPKIAGSNLVHVTEDKNFHNLSDFAVIPGSTNLIREMITWKIPCWHSAVSA
jgi:hypothetical protein